MDIYYRDVSDNLETSGKEREFFGGELIPEEGMEGHVQEYDQIIM
ncbi:Uncharacterised protein [uncultured archaeon]|nr:Uncharacterised protein [uncultured archaeon]